MAAEGPAGWWQRFGDERTDELVGQALAKNLDLRAAAARVLEAETRLRSARGARGPALDASLAASRSFNQRFFLQQADIDNYDVRATLSWQVDLFGKLRAAERARSAEWAASALDHEALAHSLVAEVVRARVALSLGLQRLDIARSIVDSRARTLQAVETRYAGGVAASSAVDVRLARENLAAAEASLPELELALTRAGFALDVLLAQRPGTSVADRGLAQALPEAAPPPLGLPAQLIDRRPDLRAAVFRTTASQAEVDVAVANLWPDLVLSAGSGFTSLEPDELFSADSFFQTIAADVGVRLFSSGQLQQEVRAAEARLAQQAAQYAAAVLTAVREVEDALAAEQRLRQQLEHVRRQLEESRLAEDLARDRYRRGLESLLTVLDTERRRAAATDQSLRLTEAVWNARIDLHLALGGDWELPGEELPQDELAHGDTTR